MDVASLAATESVPSQHELKEVKAANFDKCGQDLVSKNLEFLDIPLCSQFYMYFFST